MACRRPNTHHRASQLQRTIPLLVGDYGFARNAIDQSLITVLVMRLYPYKMYFACVVDVKGPDPYAAERLAHFIKSAGLQHFAYRSDREPAIVALIEDACKRAGRPGAGVNVPAVQDAGKTPPLTGDASSSTVLERIDEEEDEADEMPANIDRVLVAVPEHSAPGESQSSGKAERSIQKLFDLLIA